MYKRAFFDSDKYDECPYCAEKGEHVFEERRDMDDQMTISGNSVCDMLFENQLTERYLENVRDDEKPFHYQSFQAITDRSWDGLCA